MKRIKDSRSIMASTKEMRAIAREARRRGLNRQMTPAQFQLLDPKGTHVLTPIAVHEYADEQPVEPHMRMFVYLKMIGKHDAIERHLDVPFEFLHGMLDENQPQVEELLKASKEALAKLEELQTEDNGLDSGNMLVAYEYYAQALQNAKPDGAVVSTKPAPLSREQMTEVFKKLAGHPNYQGQRIYTPLEDGTTIEMQNGQIVRHRMDTNA